MKLLINETWRASTDQRQFILEELVTLPAQKIKDKDYPERQEWQFRGFYGDIIKLMEAFANKATYSKLEGNDVHIDEYLEEHRFNMKLFYDNVHFEGLERKD